MMAKHLAICERKSAYPSIESAQAATVTHSMLDVLGLVRKPEEDLTKVTESQKPVRGRSRRNKANNSEMEVKDEIDIVPSVSPETIKKEEDKDKSTDEENNEKISESGKDSVEKEIVPCEENEKEETEGSAVTEDVVDNDKIKDDTKNVDECEESSLKESNVEDEPKKLEDISEDSDLKEDKDTNKDIEDNNKQNEIVGVEQEIRDIDQDESKQDIITENEDKVEENKEAIDNRIENVTEVTDADSKTNEQPESDETDSVPIEAKVATLVEEPAIEQSEVGSLNNDQVPVPTESEIEKMDVDDALAGEKIANSAVESECCPMDTD